MVDAIKITYRKGAYHVNRPNWDGGEVVPLSNYEARERQIAELRAQSDRFCDKYLAALKRAEAAEAENARLRALPLKDEVERVLEEAASEAEKTGRDLRNDDATRRGAAYAARLIREAESTLIPRLRAGEQEGKAPAEVVGLDEYEGEITDPIERAVADRNREARIRAAAPSDPGGDRD